MICLADMAFWMSKFDNFDYNQISWKLVLSSLLIVKIFSSLENNMVLNETFLRITRYQQGRDVDRRYSIYSAIFTWASGQASEQTNERTSNWFTTCVSQLGSSELLWEGRQS